MLPPSGGRAERRGQCKRVKGLKVLPPSGGRAERRGQCKRVKGLKVLPPSGGRAERRGRRVHFLASDGLSSAVWADGRV